MRKDNSPQNLAVLRHIALNLLKHETSAKIGIHAKRLKAAWDESFLLKVLAGAFVSLLSFVLTRLPCSTNLTLAVGWICAVSYHVEQSWVKGVSRTTTVLFERSMLLSY